MLARCAHCQKTFSTERFGVQRCPHCGWEVLLSDPNAPAPQPPPPAPPGTEAAPPPAAGPEWGAPPPPMPQLPPPAWGPPPGWTGQPPGTPPPGWTGQPQGWSAPPWAAMPPGWAPLPPGTILPPPPGEGESSPFAQRRTTKTGFLAALGQTWRLVAFEPRRFFRFVRVDEPRAAVLFGVICSTIGMWASLLWAAIAGGVSTTALEQIIRRLPPGRVDPDAMIGLVQRASAGAVIGQALLTPLVGFVGIYVVAAIFHLLLLAVRGGGRGFRTTLTVVAYAYGLFLLQALPACGGLVALPWFVVVATIGLSEAQRCGPGRAAFAVLAPGLLACACGCASAVLLALQLGSGGIHLPEGTGL